jgi:two-component system, LytTR family, response regulator
MKEYAAIIIDDEKNIREALCTLLEQYCPEIRVCGTAGSASEGRKLLEENEVDFIFLDISMPREDGFTFLRSIPYNEYGIIFATAHQEHALRALKANAIDYLLKPIHPVELKEAVDKAISNWEMRRNYSEVRNVLNQSFDNFQENIQSKNKHISKITVTEQFGFRIVNTEELMYLEADSNYTNLHLTDGKKIIATRNMGEFEKILDDRFFRIHKSIIINLNFVMAYSSYQGNTVEMKDGSNLIISRRKVLELRDRIIQFSNTSY